MRSKTVAFLVTCASYLAFPAGTWGQVQIAARGANITFGGRLHTQFIASSADTADSQFFFRRARLQADVRVNEFLDGRLEADFVGGRAEIQDAYARLTFGEGLALSAGQFKRAFSIVDLLSANDIPVIERDGKVPGERCAGVGGACSYSRLTQQLQFDGRDMGLRAEGDLSERIRYATSLTNGQGTNANDVNDTKSFSGRVELTPVEGVRLGVFGALHDYPDPLPVNDTDHAQAFGADLEVGTFRQDFHLIAGAVIGDNWRIEGAPTFLAAQAIASWFMPLEGERLSGWEPLLRVSWATPNRDAEDVAGLLLTPGVMFYFQGRNGLALNLDSYSPDGDRDSAWSFKAQIFLYF